MFPNYFPAAFRIKQVGMFPIWGWLRGCASPGQGELVPREPWWEQSLLWASAPAFESCLQSRAAGPFFSLPGIKRNVWWWISICYFDDVWFIFWTWKGSRKRESWSYLWKILFYHLITLSLFLLSQISLFMSFPLLYLLVYFICKLLPCPCELVIQVLQST